MNSLSWGLVLGVLLSCVPAGLAREKVIAPDLSHINNRKTWSVLNAEVSTASEKGTSVVRLKPKGPVGPGSNIGLALVEGVEFTEGALEIDLKGNGEREASFLGVAFGVASEKSFEAVYFRPFNFRKQDRVFRGRAVQYVAWPQYTWEKLRKDKPGRYESAVKPIPDPSGWFHARVEVTKKQVRVWVEDAKDPCLVVDRLASREKGKVGLLVDSKESAFRNFKIRPSGTK
jgi:hypothetical protein